MSKKVKSYNLSKEVINAISEKAADDERKDSDWLNRFLTKHLCSKKKSTAIAPKEASKRFVVPTDVETVSFFVEKGSDAKEAEKFWLFYDSKNWMVGKNKMKNWHSAASRWIKQNADKNQSALEQSSNSDWHLQNQGF